MKFGETLRIDSDENMVDTIDGFNAALKEHGLCFEDDGLAHDGFMLLTLRKAMSEVHNESQERLNILDSLAEGSAMSEVRNESQERLNVLDSLAEGSAVNPEATSRLGDWLKRRAQAELDKHVRHEIQMLVKRGQITRAEVEKLRCNSWEWEHLVPALDDHAFVLQLEHAFANCGHHKRPYASYNEAVEGLFAPELLKRFKGNVEALSRSVMREAMWKARAEGRNLEQEFLSSMNPGKGGQDPDVLAAKAAETAAAVAAEKAASAAKSADVPEATDILGSSFVRDIHNEDVSVWVRSGGFYVLLSFNQGAKTFVFDHVNAEQLGQSLIDSAKLAADISEDDARIDSLEKDGFFRASSVERELRTALGYSPQECTEEPSTKDLLEEVRDLWMKRKE
jgi:hypothetical protein